MRKLSGVAVLLLIWEAVARLGWVNPWLLIPPSTIPAALLKLAASGELVRHLSATVTRLGAAFIAGSGVGLAVGLAAGGFRGFGFVVEPLLAGLYTMPKIALLPVAIALLGIGESSRAMPAVLAAFSLMALHSMEAARGVPRPMVELARCYGATGWTLARSVHIPACLPALFTGLRLSLGLALVLVISTEMLGAIDGVGSLIWIAGQTLAMENLFAGLFLCATLGVTTMLVLGWIERKLIPWSVHR